MRGNQAGRVSTRTELAAGILLADVPASDRQWVIADAANAFDLALNRSAVWQSGFLPPDLRGDRAYGDELPRWQAGIAVTSEEEAAINAAWDSAMPPLGRGMSQYLRARVEGPADVLRLRAIGAVDGLTVVPSLDSRGGGRSFEWRWPFRVGVAPGATAEDWLAEVRDTSHHGVVFDAELCNQAHSYDIALVNAADLPHLGANWLSVLNKAACVIVAGVTPAEQQLLELDELVQPTIAVAVTSPPAAWWRPLFNEMSHDSPIDVAVEVVVRSTGIDGLISGPRWGLDVTASAHWFAAVAPDVPELTPLLDSIADWNWREERGGATTESRAVRALRLQAKDPKALVPATTRSAAMPAPDDTGEGRELELLETPSTPAKPRRIVARVLDGGSAVKSILPPTRDLSLAVRIAIPEKHDVADEEAAFPEPAGDSPTVELEVVVRGNVWPDPPGPQKASLSREKPTQPSSWAVFPFTTPESGEVVSIEIVVLYQGKPLQAATYVSPVRTAALPGERPTLTTFKLSGPDEPTGQMRVVDATLDGRGAQLADLQAVGGTVLITEVQRMLDAIEDRVSRVLGVTGAPDSFDDPRALGLLVTLARLGSELKTILDPLRLAHAKRINVIVNPDTRVLPIEVAYDGPPPDAKRAKLCRHVGTPPPEGQACDRVSRRTVCPYAFWGLNRSIARTVASTRRGRQPSPTRPLPAVSMLYAATEVADDGATDPKPSDRVLAAAKAEFQPVTRVTSWTAWRKAVRSTRPGLLVVLGHTLVEGGETKLYIGRNSSLSRVDISPAMLRPAGSPAPIVLLIACATAALGDPFGTLPGALTAHGAGAVVGTLAKIVGSHGAAATLHLLDSIHSLSGSGASVGDAVTRARRSLVAEKRPTGLILVSHGEIDTAVVA
jgi:hypothetical protein